MRQVVTCGFPQVQRLPRGRGIGRELEEGMLDQEERFPLARLTCPLCGCDIDLSVCDSVLEVLWMHEYDCTEVMIAADEVSLAA